LDLHIALSCGDVTNIILGDINPPNSNRLSNASSNNNSNDGNRKSRLSYISASGDVNPLDASFEYSGRLEYAICGPAVESLEDALSAAKAGEMSITSDAYSLFQNQAMSLSYEKRGQFYVVKSTESLRKNNTRNNNNNNNNNNNFYSTMPAKIPTTPNASYLAERPGLLTRAKTLNIEPLIPRTRDTSYLELSNDPNPNYLKYINRSALYRLQHSPDDNFPAQFRDATIMFVSLGKLNVATPAGIQVAQKAVHFTIQTLVKYEGILQQFAVDDKGATLLAVFGLPPLSHEREAVFAAKAAIEIRDYFNDILSDEDFSISLSTGIIFNAVLPQGNPYRRDPAIAGDTIILAVRMLKFSFSKKSIVCDFATKQQIGRACDFEDFGENFVKGKIKPIQIFGITGFAATRTKRISTQSQEKISDFIGYKSEMKRATDIAEDWMDTPNYHVVVISGPSGVGKSYFCQALSKYISSQAVTCCWSSSTEVEKSSKYYLVKNLLLAIFEIIDTGQVPHNPRRRVPYLSNGALVNDYSNIHTDGSFTSSGSSPVPSPTSKETPKAPFRMATYSTKGSSTNEENGPLSPTSAGGNNGGETGNEMSDLICRCLRVCGEEDGFLPLFKVIFASLADQEENKYTSRLDGRGRDILLIGVITRMVRYVSDHVGLVLISDDVQCKKKFYFYFI
jgi:hypothetical protein